MALLSCVIHSEAEHYIIYVYERQTCRMISVLARGINVQQYTI